MRLRRLGAAALALTTAGLLTATAINGADAQKKKKPAPKKPTPVSSNAIISEGKAVYLRSGCAACHKIGATGGATGPELSAIGKSKTPPQLMAYVRDPKKVNPKSIMPASSPSQINDKQLKALGAYLHSLK